LRELALHGIPPFFAPIDNPLQAVPPLERVLTAAVVQLRYLRLLAVPIGLSSDYSYDEIPIVRDPLDPRVLAFALLVIAAAAITWRARRERSVLAIAIGGYAILFSVTSNFLAPIGTIMAERLAYMPSILFCALAGIALWEVRSRSARRAAAVVASLACGLFLALTIARNQTWSDELAFSRAQVASAPNSAKAHANLASALGDVGDDRGVVAEYEKALAILPAYPRAHFELGNALHRLNEDPARIVDAYLHAIALDPRDVDARVNLAWTLVELGRPDEARAVVDEITDLKPDHPEIARLAKRVARRRPRRRPSTGPAPRDLDAGAPDRVAEHTGAHGDVADGTMAITAAIATIRAGAGAPDRSADATDRVARTASGPSCRRRTTGSFPPPSTTSERLSRRRLALASISLASDASMTIPPCDAHLARS